ncbi:hypothetical protein EDD22DRAFT_896431 [Suillus occidentalis]|nr:hypothetical protein EDD22DRAFT_896431 [Suillus occidentalis]
MQLARVQISSLHLADAQDSLVHQIQCLLSRLKPANGGASAFRDVSHLNPNLQMCHSLTSSALLLAHISFTKTLSPFGFSFVRSPIIFPCPFSSQSCATQVSSVVITLLTLTYPCIAFRILMLSIMECMDPIIGPSETSSEYHNYSTNFRSYVPRSLTLLQTSIKNLKIMSMVRLDS